MSVGIGMRNLGDHVAALGGWRAQKHQKCVRLSPTRTQSDRWRGLSFGRANGRTRSRGLYDAVPRMPPAKAAE